MFKLSILHTNIMLIVCFFCPCFENSAHDYVRLSYERMYTIMYTMYMIVRVTTQINATLAEVQPSLDVVGDLMTRDAIPGAQVIMSDRQITLTLKRRR